MREKRSGRSLKAACGVFASLLLFACGPEMPGEDMAGGEEFPPEVQRPQVEEPPSNLTPTKIVQAASSSRNWFVSLKGSDLAAGTRGAPLRTVGRAVALARPGDVIRVLPGVYSEELLLESRGSGAAPITLRGEGSPRATIVPRNRARSSVIRVQGRWHLENLKIDVGGARMFAVLFDSGASKSVLSGSELKGGTSGAGVVVEGARDVTIQGNTIHHFIKPADDSHGVVVIGPSRNIVIRENDIHHNSGDSVQCQAGNNNVPADTVLIEGNTLHEEGENGVDIKRCQRITIRNNVIGGFPNTAIRPRGTSAGEAVVLHQSARDIVIQGNSISRAGRGISILGTSTPTENVRIEGNHIQGIRNFPEGNGQGIRVASARNVVVVGNTIENTASYGLMLAADGKVVNKLTVRNNTLRKGSQPRLLRLGASRFRPGLILEGNNYASGGILKADGVFEQLTLSSSANLQMWRQKLGADHGCGLLE